MLKPISEETRTTGLMQGIIKSGQNQSKRGMREAQADFMASVPGSTSMFSSDVSKCNKIEPKRTTVQRDETALQTNFHLVLDTDVPTHSVASAIEAPSSSDIPVPNHRNRTRSRRQRPLVPKRSTSISRPPKRKRHEDFVAFHRNSCHLFSSIDGTLAQMRTVASSYCSSPSSSDSTTPVSSPSSPILRSSTRMTDVDCNQLAPLLGQTMANADANGSSRKRPSLQRTQCSASLFCQSPPVYQALEHSEDPNCSVSPSKQSNSKTLQQQIVTKSTYSSQATLPLSQNTHGRLDSTSTAAIHWTSPESRRREYAKIDSANSGFRLLLRRVLPRSLRRKIGGGRADFYKDCAESDQDGDAQSVRRFRLSDNDAEDVIETHEHKQQPMDEYKRWNEKLVDAESSIKLTDPLRIPHEHISFTFDDDRKEGIAKVSERSLFKKILSCCS